MHEHYDSNTKGKSKSVIVGGDNDRNVKVLPEDYEREAEARAAAEAAFARTRPRRARWRPGALRFFPNRQSAMFMSLHKINYRTFGCYGKAVMSYLGQVVMSAFSQVQMSAFVVRMLTSGRYPGAGGMGTPYDGLAEMKGTQGRHKERKQRDDLNAAPGRTTTL